MGKISGGYLEGLPGTALGDLAFLFVDCDFQRLQEFLILRRQFDLASRFELSLGWGFGFYSLNFTVFRFVLPVFFAFVKPYRCFQYQEDILARALNLSDSSRNAVGVGQRFVDRIAKLLHQLFEFFFQRIAPFFSSGLLLKNNTTFLM